VSTSGPAPRPDSPPVWSAGKESPARLLVSLPALDEAATIADVIEAIPREIVGIGEVRVLVVDDGSADETASLARAAGAHVIRHDVTRGVGAAFQTALAHARESGADFFVTLDADGQFDPAEIPRVMAPVLEGRADCATGSRFLDPALEPEMPRMKRWGNRQVARIVSGLTGRRFADVSCGMRCYGREAVLRLNLLGKFTYTHEVLLDLCFKGLRVVEVPIRVRGEREYGESRVAGSLLRYAINTTRIIVGSYRDYNPLRFFGAIALALFVPALLLELFFFGHYLATGSFSPHKWAGFSGAGLGILSLLMVFMGMIGDMLNRHRVYLEELLYEQRRDKSARSQDSADRPGAGSVR
jgi:glycosyltransferase involved in cell wall biosynthesis